MANILKSIKGVTENQLLHIQEILPNGKIHRRVLSPDEDVSGESEKVQEKAASLWTDEVKESWTAKKNTDEQEIRNKQNE